MKVRYHMRNTTNMVEFECSELGLQQAREFRKQNPEFKRRRIVQVIQARPLEVVLGVVYQLT